MKYRCESCGQYDSLSNMFFCPSCEKLVCSSLSCIRYAVDYLYCWSCLDAPPMSEAKEMGFRCTTCFQCPQCMSKLHALLVPETVSSDQPLHNWYCFGCGWNSSTINLTAPSRSDLIVETDRLIKEKNQKRQEAIKDISKAVQLQLGIQPVEKQPYKMPLSAENSVNSDNCKGKKPLFSFDVEKSISELTCRDQDVLPSHPVLSSKRKIFCRQCKSVGSGLLCNFNLQPLGGDSTLAHGQGNWFRSSCFAMYAVPTFTLIQQDDSSSIIRIQNPGAETLSNVTGEMTVSISQPISISCTIPSYSSYTVDYDSLKQMNVGKNYVKETGENYVVVEFPKSMTIFDVLFSYKKRDGQTFSHTFSIRME